jgi:TRAP-type C4-dicarboxylate transport system permease small subunit
MRQFLDSLYRASGGLAALFLAAICLIVVIQVVLNLIDKVAALVFGGAIGLAIPSYSDFAGFFLAAASFLAMAYTFRQGGHIRVGLLISGAGDGPRRYIEIWCLLVGTALIGFFAFHTTGLVLESLEYNDLSSGMVAVPIWIPQSSMALGLIILTIAMIDELIKVICGEIASYVVAEKNADPLGPGSE